MARLPSPVGEAVAWAPVLGLLNSGRSEKMVLEDLDQHRQHQDQDHQDQGQDSQDQVP